MQRHLFLLFYAPGAAALALRAAAGHKQRYRSSINMVLEDAPQVVALTASLPESTPARWRKSTKQLATVGPASSTSEMLEKLFAAGVDVFRLNFSHGSHDEKRELIEKIRQLEKTHGHPIGILADLQGPKLRVGVFDKGKAMLVQGQSFRFDDVDEPGDASRVRLPHPEILQTLNEDDILLVDDGKLRLQVTSKDNDGVDCEVIVGGTISDRKGVNTPSITIPISPLTPKDRADLAFALTQNIDWVALSFVQRPEDIEELRTIVKNSERPFVRLMAKIEKPQAVQDIERIVELCDGIMVARGDLGVEMNPEDVPVVQKTIINLCRSKGVPVVVATQMLESMIESPTPTRAECSDVATALYDGADAVMLSAESAAGAYPEEAVTMQRRVISRVEADPYYRKAHDALVGFRLLEERSTTTDAVTLAASQIAGAISAKVLIVFTSEGTTVLTAASLRPNVPILALTPNEETARALSLCWGVYARLLAPQTFDENQIFADVLGAAVDVAVDYGLLENESDVAVVTAGLPWGTPGASNVLRVVPMMGPDAWPEDLCRVGVDEACA